MRSDSGDVYVLGWSSPHVGFDNPRVLEHLGCIAQVEIKVTTLGAFLQAVLDVVISRLGLADMTCVYGKGGVLIRVGQKIIRKQFEMVIFRPLRHMHCNTTLPTLAIARLAEVDWEDSGIEWVAFVDDQ